MNDNAPHRHPKPLSEADLPLSSGSRNERMNDTPRFGRKMILFSAIFGLTIAGAVWWYMPRGLPTASEKTDILNPAAVSEPAFIAALGHFEPVGGVIAVTPPLASRNAVVTEILINNGAQVRAGQIIALLETRPGAEAALDQAKAEMALREADLAKVRRTLISDKAELEAQIALAKVQLAGTEQSLDRARRLAGSGSATQASFEDLQTSRDSKAAELEQAEARRVRLEGETDDHPDIKSAMASLEAAKAAFQQRLTELGNTAIRSPANGTIIAVPGRKGEPAPSNGVVRLAVEGPSRAILEVHQDRIQLLRPGAQVTLRAAAFDGFLDRQGRKHRRRGSTSSGF